MHLSVFDRSGFGRKTRSGICGPVTEPFSVAAGLVELVSLCSDSVADCSVSAVATASLLAASLWLPSAVVSGSVAAAGSAAVVAVSSASAGAPVDASPVATSLSDGGVASCGSEASCDSAGGLVRVASESIANSVAFSPAAEKSSTIAGWGAVCRSASLVGSTGSAGCE